MVRRFYSTYHSQSQTDPTLTFPGLNSVLLLHPYFYTLICAYLLVRVDACGRNVQLPSVTCFPVTPHLISLLPSLPVLRILYCLLSFLCRVMERGEDDWGTSKAAPRHPYIRGLSLFYCFCCFVTLMFCLFSSIAVLSLHFHPMRTGE